MRVFVFTAALATIAAAAPARGVVGGGDVSFEAKGANKAVFSHEAHVVAARLRCQDCHARLYLDTKRSPHATMRQMQKGKSCGACHDGKRAFSVSVSGDCTKCHR
jgi:c(7)-type cytochrome triheme protein